MYSLNHGWLLQSYHFNVITAHSAREAERLPHNSQCSWSPEICLTLTQSDSSLGGKRGTIPMCTLLDHSFFHYALLSIPKNQHHARQYETKIKNRSSQRTQSPPGRVKHGQSSPYLMAALRTTKVLQVFLKCYTGL